MPNRRQFLAGVASATAGVLFGGAGVLRAARRQVGDSLVFTAEGLRHLVAESGSSQIVLGTDAPFPWTTTAVDHVLDTRTLSDADKIAILGGNLIKLLRIDSVS